MGTSPEGTSGWAFELSGGRLSLDFTNTISGDRSGETREHLHGYADLVAWARQSGAIGPEHGRHLLSEARRRPREADAVFREAIALREALFRAFSATADRRRPPQEEDLSHVSSSLGRALSHRRLERREDGIALGWDDPPDALDAPLWRVAADAAELLTSPADLARVRVCGLHDTHECSWVFMDTTRAHTRRWCSMESCGNKAKARRHYARAKGS